MHLTEFLDYIKFEKRLSVHTQIAYETDLKEFESFLKENFEVSLVEANHQFIRNWLVKLMENNITAKSVNRKISTLKSFYKFLLKKEIIEVNPLMKIKSPKIPKRLPVFVEENKLKNLFEEIPFENDFEGIRDKLILELLYGCGIRLSELIGLINQNVSTNQIKVLGKGNKERIIPIHQHTADLIKKYKAEKNNLNHNLNESVFFVLNNGKKLYPKFVYNKVKYYLGMVTSMNKRSPHILRHSFATHLLNHGAEINAIKELLGHSSLAATQVYTHNSIEKLKNIYTKSHPLAGK